MLTLFSPTHVSWLLSAGFAGTAAVHLSGYRALREAYDRWQYPRGFREVTGTLLLLAGVFLAFPLTRFWGIAIAAVVMFLSATTLVDEANVRMARTVLQQIEDAR